MLALEPHLEASAPRDTPSPLSLWTLLIPAPREDGSIHKQGRAGGRKSGRASLLLAFRPEDQVEAQK